MYRSANIVPVLMLVGATPVIAQRASFSVGPRSGFPMARRGPGVTISFHGTPHGTPAGSFQRFHGFPQGLYGSSFFYPDYYTAAQPAELAPSAPQVIVMQPATDKPQRDARDEKPTQMLLLERRGDHFVRVGESDAEHESRAANKNVEGASHTLSSGSSEHRAIPPAVLIFRDGHREEVSSYTISQGILYATSNYWETGTWANRVQLTSLDLPATLRENQARGSRFVLPAGPNEVAVRP
jgi:hypothetical protein